MAEMPEFTISAVKILRAFKPGDIVFIEYPGILPAHQIIEVSANG